MVNRLGWSGTGTALRMWDLQFEDQNHLVQMSWSLDRHDQTWVKYTGRQTGECVSHLFPCHLIVTLLPTSVIRADFSREATQLDFYVNSLIFSVVQTLKEKQKNNHITCSKQNAPSHWPWALGQPPYLFGPSAEFPSLPTGCFWKKHACFLSWLLHADLFLQEAQDGN